MTTGIHRSQYLSRERKKKVQMIFRKLSRSFCFSGIWKLSFVAVLFASNSLLAQSGPTYYVSTAGNDSNPGTRAEPWLTIQHAANTVTAGATVYVFGGVYNQSINFPNSGTASAPLTFESFPR